jgi:hypothetical protein
MVSRHEASILIEQFSQTSIWVDRPRAGQETGLVGMAAQTDQNARTAFVVAGAWAAFYLIAVVHALAVGN